MNKAYKVVFNKFRGTMMVVNEATSSIQKKGAKTVIAAAAVAMLAGVAGTAMAEEAETPTKSAQIGETQYDTFKGALDASVAQDKIVVLKDLEYENGYSFGRSSTSTTYTTAKNVTIDLNGHLYKVAKDPSAGSSGTETQAFQFLKSAGDVKFTNGQIVFDTTNTTRLFRGFQNYSNLTLDHVDVDGTMLARTGYGVMSNAFGNSVISNSTIKYASDNYSIVVGYWADNGYGDGVELKIIDSTIEGSILVEIADTNPDNIGKKHHLYIDGGTLSAMTEGRKIYNEGYTEISNTSLSNNINGGAIENKGAEKIAGSLTVTNVTFDQNKTNDNGAAIVSQGGTITVAGATIFTGNQAANGGAIHNTGGTISIDGAEFLSNSASGLGGAIYNAGTLTLQGKNYFEGNTSNGKLNDIYNAAGAKLNLSGDLTLNGGILNAGTVDFIGKTTITTILTSDAIQNGSYDLIAKEEGSNGEIKNIENASLADNAIYNITWDANNDGSIKVALKSANEIVESLPVTAQQAGTVAAVLPILTNSATAPAQVAAIADAISVAAQTGNGEAVAQIAEDLAPSTAPVVSSVSQGVNNAIAGVANARMAANRAAGDVFTGGSAWAQMIYNSADQDATKKTAKLESDTYGVTVGVDGKIGDNLTIGAGFGVTKTDAESGTRDIDVDSYALFGYTEYNADNGWFVNGMVNAIRGRYEENKAPAGVKLTAKYQTTVLGAGVATGYHFENGISPEVGLRYLRTHQGSYNDGAQKIHTDGTNLLTASIGAKYEKAFEQGDWVLKPSARVAATYDVVSDDTESAIRVIGGGQYHVISEHQKRAAYEAGIGLEASNGDWDFSVSYNGEFRSHFQSHTGMLKAKYNF